MKKIKDLSINSSFEKSSLSCILTSPKELYIYILAFIFYLENLHNNASCVPTNDLSNS